MVRLPPVERQPPVVLGGAAEAAEEEAEAEHEDLVLHSMETPRPVHVSCTTPSKQEVPRVMAHYIAEVRPFGHT